MENQRAPFRVLSIDGGGIRGLYTAVLLHGLAQRVARMKGQPEDRLDIGSAFHLIEARARGRFSQQPWRLAFRWKRSLRSTETKLHLSSRIQYPSLAGPCIVGCGDAAQKLLTRRKRCAPP